MVEPCCQVGLTAVYHPGALTMGRANLRTTCLLLVVVLTVGCSESPKDASLMQADAQAQNDRPNILLIVADDLGYTDLGAFGGEIQTPNLDALALAGIRFTNFHTNALCQETRAMLMSAMGAAAAIKSNPPRQDGERANQLRADIATLPELLRDAGYSTYMAGKWDLGLTDEAMPHARGFDRSFSLLEASASHFAEPFWSDVSYYQEDSRRLDLDELGDGFYSTRGYTDKLLTYLESHDDSAPWFGYLAYTAPHWPLQVPGDWMDRNAGRYDEGYDVLRAARFSRAEKTGVIPSGATLDAFQATAEPWVNLDPETRRRYSRAQEIYASMVEYLDREIGRIVEHLEQKGQLRQTVILFISDHGSSAAELGIVDGPTGMPQHFNRALERSDNSFDNIGRRGSFVDHGRGYAEAATAPFRLFKGTLSEGGIRAAAFLHYPVAHRQAGINDTFFTVMDILPTFLELAGTTHPGAVEYNGRQVQAIAGRSFWNVIEGGHETVHGESDAAGWSLRGRGALIKGRYKLTNQPNDGRPVKNSDLLPWHLYDLSIDPGEATDLAEQHPKLVAEMKAEWELNWR